MSTASISNQKKLSSLLKEMSDMYGYLGPEHRFRANAYDKASKTIANLNEDLSVLHDTKKLEALKGIGSHIAAKIIEYLDTGKITAYEELKKKLPGDLLELTKLEGIGPATIRHLHDELHIEDRKALKVKLIGHTIHRVKGVDQLKLKIISEALKIPTFQKFRMPYKKAKRIATFILQDIHKINGVIKACEAGSLRREKETIGDLDILLIADKNDHKNILDAIHELPQINRIISAGSSKSSMKLNEEGVQLDVRIVLPTQEGSAMLYFTGSKAFNISMRKIAKQKGYLLNEYGLFDRSNGNLLAGKTEQEIFDKLHIPFVAPREREASLPQYEYH